MPLPETVAPLRYAPAQSPSCLLPKKGDHKGTPLRFFVFPVPYSLFPVPCSLF